MSKVLEGLRYSESHEWVKVEGGIAVIGVSDFAQAEMGDITYVDLPEVDDEVVAGEEFGALESVKASSELYAPVSGKVVEVNAALEDSPELVNEDAAIPPKWKPFWMRPPIKQPSTNKFLWLDLPISPIRRRTSVRCCSGLAWGRWTTSTPMCLTG